MISICHVGDSITSFRAQCWIVTGYGLYLGSITRYTCVLAERIPTDRCPSLVQVWSTFYAFQTLTIIILKVNFKWNYTHADSGSINHFLISFRMGNKQVRELHSSFYQMSMKLWKGHVSVASVSHSVSKGATLWSLPMIPTIQRLPRPARTQTWDFTVQPRSPFPTRH